MRKRNVYLLLIGAMLGGSLLTGCADNPQGRHAVTGTVTLYGTPLEQGAIEFHPLSTGGTQSGGIISEGKFSISEQYGLAAGEYRVRVMSSEEPEPLPAGFMPGDDLPPEPKQLVPPDWNQTVTIAESGPFEFTFDITLTKK